MDSSSFIFEVYDPFGKQRGVVGDITSWSYTTMLNGLPTLSLSIPADSPCVKLLEAPCEVALCVYDAATASKSEPPNARFISMGVDVDRAASSQVFKYSFLGVGVAFRWATVWEPSLDADGNKRKDGKREIAKGTPGTIIRGLLNAAAGRVGSDGLRWGNGELDWSSFSAGTDSAGQAWLKNGNPTFNVSDTLEKVLKWWASKGAIDWYWQGRGLQVLNPSVAPSALEESQLPFINGQTVTAEPLKVSFENVATMGRFRGNNGFVKDLEFPGRFTALGRIEKWSEQNTDGGEAASALYLAQLQAKGLRPDRQLRREYLLDDAESLHLWEHYGPGDWVRFFRPGDERPEVLRVVESGLSMDQDGQVKGWDTLGTRIANLVERLAARTSSQSAGAVGAETGAPVTQDSFARLKAPKELVVSSPLVRFDEVERRYRAYVSVSWGQDGKTVDGANKEAKFWRVYLRQGGVTVTAAIVKSRQAEIEIPVNRQCYVSVSAFDKNDVESARSGEVLVAPVVPSVVPPPPSAPLVTVDLGVATVSWDGRDKDSLDMPGDFDAVDVGISTDGVSFDPYMHQVLNKGALDGRKEWVIPLSPGTYYCAIRVFNKYGQRSGWSKAARFTVTSLVSEETLRGLVGESMPKFLEKFSRDQEAVFNELRQADKTLGARIDSAPVEIGRLRVGTVGLDQAVAREFAASKAFVDTLWANTIVSMPNTLEVLQDPDYTKKTWKTVVTFLYGETIQDFIYIGTGYIRVKFQVNGGGIDYGTIWRSDYNRVTGSTSYVFTSGVGCEVKYAQGQFNLTPRIVFYDANKKQISSETGETMRWNTNSRMLPEYFTMNVSTPYDCAFIRIEYRYRASNISGVNYDPPNRSHIVFTFNKASLREMFSGTVIKHGTISTDQIAANAITSEKLKAGSVTASIIAADSITGAHLKADAIDGKVITGATLQTSKEQRGWKINDNGISFYNSAGARTAYHDGFGSRWYSQTHNSNCIEINNDMTDPEIRFRSRAFLGFEDRKISASIKLGAEDTFHFTDRGALMFFGQSLGEQPNGKFDQTSLRLGPGKQFSLVTLNDVDPKTFLGAGEVVVEGTSKGELFLNSTNHVEIRSKRISLVNLPKHTSLLHVGVQPNNTNWQFFYDSSSIENKITPRSIRADAHRLLELEPKDWYDAFETEQYANYLEDHARDRSTDPRGEWDEYNQRPKRVPGLIAEDVEAAGLGEFCFYDTDGKLLSIMYDRLWVLTIPLLKDALARIELLEQQVKKGAVSG